MARGSRLLKILVHPSMANSPEILALQEKGHEVHTEWTPSTSLDSNGESVWQYDLILGPNCWRMDTRLVKYLDLAVKMHRLLKYGPSSRKDKDNDS